LEVVVHFYFLMICDNKIATYANTNKKTPGFPGVLEWRWGELNPFQTL
jgi:hypothetical protein